MTYIGTPPAKFVIPVTLGADRPFSVNRKDTDGNPVDWAADVFIVIDITTPPQQIDATVSSATASFLIPSDVCDQVKSSTKWRMYMQTPLGDSTLTTPLAVGGFERDDGGRS